jgi:hypothetical protein
LLVATLLAGGLGSVLFSAGGFSAAIAHPVSTVDNAQRMTLRDATPAHLAGCFGGMLMRKIMLAIPWAGQEKTGDVFTYRRLKPVTDQAQAASERMELSCS